MSRPHPLLARFAPLALLVAVGCGKFRKNRECTELAGAVNAFIGETQKAVPAEYADPARAARESKALAQRYRKLSGDLAGLKIESDELEPRLERYRKLAEQAALALEGASVALERKNLEQARRHRLEFDRAAKDEAPLVREINAECSR